MLRTIVRKHGGSNSWPPFLLERIIPMASPYQIIRGEVGQTKWLTPATESHPWPLMLADGVWKDVDLSDSRITCNAYHSDGHVLGRNGDNLRLRQSASGGLEYECTSRGDSVTNDVRFEILTKRIESSSLQYEIGKSHFATFNGVQCLVVDSVKRLFHVGPVTQGLCSCASVSLEKQSQFTSHKAVTNSAGKRRVPMMNVGPMPAGLRNGMLIASAAERGEGCSVKGIRLSAVSVQSLISNRQHAIL